MDDAQRVIVRILWRRICAYYPNRRVVHLANRHRDPLVRKKNMKRILRHVGAKCKGGQA